MRAFGTTKRYKENEMKVTITRTEYAQMLTQLVAARRAGGDRREAYYAVKSATGDLSMILSQAALAKGDV